MATTARIPTTQPMSHWGEQDRSRQRKNVGEAERLFSVLGGSALALYGLGRGTLGGLALAMFGTGFVCRGVAGHCMVYQALGINTAEEPQGRAASIPAGHGIKVEKSITDQQVSGRAVSVLARL